MYFKIKGVEFIVKRWSFGWKYKKNGKWYGSFVGKSRNGGRVAQCAPPLRELG